MHPADGAARKPNMYPPFSGEHPYPIGLPPVYLPGRADGLGAKPCAGPWLSLPLATGAQQPSARGEVFTTFARFVASSNETYFNPAPEPAAAAQRHAQLAALLAQSSSGNCRAFEAFYTLTLSVATAVVRRIVGTSLVEDVLADAYFQVWRDAARFDAARGNALTWVLTIARSRALDRLRAEKLRHDGQTGAPSHDAEADVDEAQPGPDALVQATQEHSRLHQALARLSPNERWVLGLAYFRDMSHGEIAGETRLPLGTVKSLISRAQVKLRDELESGAGLASQMKTR